MCRSLLPLTLNSVSRWLVSVSKIKLFRRERCRPLVHVGRDAFLRIVALEEDLLVLAFEGQRGFHRNLPTALHGALDAAYRFCRLVRRTELPRVLHDVFHEVFP